MMRQRSLHGLQDALHDLEREVDVRTRSLAQLQQHVVQLRELIAFVEASSEEGASPVFEAPQHRERAQPTKAARNALVDILKVAGGPMHSRDLLKELLSRGIEVGGRDPAGTVRSHLSHDDRFVPRGHGLWALASQLAAPNATMRPGAVISQDGSRVIRWPALSKEEGEVPVAPSAEVRPFFDAPRQRDTDLSGDGDPFGQEGGPARLSIDQ